MTAALVGYMPMPAGFPYAEIFRRGRPKHGKPGDFSTYDAFYIRHPPMETSRRAKIFAPFDALKGFSAAVAAKEVLYVEKSELTESEKDDLDKKIRLLEKARKSNVAKISVGVTFFQECEDPENEGYGHKGTYNTVTGHLQKIDFLHRTMILDSGTINVDDISQIACPGLEKGACIVDIDRINVDNVVGPSFR